MCPSTAPCFLWSSLSLSCFFYIYSWFGQYTSSYSTTSLLQTSLLLSFSLSFLPSIFLTRWLCCLLLLFFLRLVHFWIFPSQFVVVSFCCCWFAHKFQKPKKISILLLLRWFLLAAVVADDPISTNTKLFASLSSCMWVCFLYFICFLRISGSGGVCECVHGKLPKEWNMPKCKATQTKQNKKQKNREKELSKEKKQPPATAWMKT